MTPTVAIPQSAAHAAEVALQEQCGRLAAQKPADEFDRAARDLAARDAARALVAIREVLWAEPEQSDPVTAAKAADDRDYHAWQSERYG